MVSQGEYADETDRRTDGRTDGRQTVTLHFPLDATNVIISHKLPVTNVFSVVA